MNKPTICILHGWSLEKELKNRWQPLINLLKKDGFKVKYLSLPGFDEPLLEPFDLDKYRDHVTKQLKDFSSVVIIGHSFGGQLAVHLAATGLNKIKGMVIIGPAGIINNSLSKIIKRTVFRWIAKIGFACVTYLPNTLQHFFKKALYFFVREKDYFKLSDENFKKTMQQVIYTEIKDDFVQVKVPTLIIWGDKDKYTPIKHAPLFAAGIHKAQLKIMRGEGHRPYYSQPKTVASHIIYFLERYVD